MFFPEKKSKFINNPLKKISSFSLAEVLITLSIIGIIAALTIPNLYAKYQKKEMETRFTEFYSLMSNAIKIYMTEKGCSDLYCAGWEGVFRNTPVDAPWTEGAIIPVAREFAKVYLKSTKQKFMLAGPNYDWGNNFKALDGGVPNVWMGATDIVCETAFCFWLPNGARVGFPANGTGGCTKTANDTDKCSYLNVDLNGDKGPNRYGYDIFLLQVNKNGSITSRSTECDAPSEKTGRRYGMGCSDRIMKNGWKIDYWD